ncbi:hypothetical protein CYLTODRAFT_490969 [Cylindrobasidium torrendii FP15055 ss-10]|uniref:Cytochrome c oxidase subunit 8, mitochondrial n=1 Tax=Cylindrobasidium torrendii FP15055 ss-10 TaxID=1314674 RepID=A0A0D7BBW9_9AGAR|nr:hypothetical protein CYLTODRAFT_490969 [Cylindrobasidium torrendii FP15055 ss-10]
MIPTVVRRSPHSPPGYHLPFTYANKTTFLYAKLVPFTTIAFGIPMVAIWWRWNKKGGLKNP